MHQKASFTDKIQALFAYRRIPWMLDLAGLREDKELISNLYRLQESIYALDKYLESQWTLDQADLQEYWNRIYANLGISGIGRREIPVWCKGLEQYQELETGMRSNKLPLRKTLKATYTVKSCDVRLMRQCIYHAAPQLEQQVAFRDWQAYDLVTEVNDDITDVYEDTDTYNGNRFLISLIVNGRKRTDGEYQAFLDDISQLATPPFTPKQGRQTRDLRAWTERRISETRALMRRRLSQKKLDSVHGSLLARTLGIQRTKNG